MATNAGAPAELENIGEVLRLYAKALTGHEIRLIPRGGSGGRGAGWRTPTHEGKATPPTSPSRIDRSRSQRENFDWYKVILTHQSGHAEFGTFQFALNRASRLFNDWRPALAAKSSSDIAADDRQALRALFPDPVLGMTIFECVEDARVDSKVLARYPGIERAYRHVALRVLSERPRLPALPLREAFVEALLQASLGGNPVHDAPERLRLDLESALEYLSRVNDAVATVEDSAEAALRIYQIAARLPNTVADDECCHDHEHQHHPANDDSTPDRLEESVKDPQEVPFKAPPEVEFRLQMQEPFLDRKQQKSNAESQPAEDALEGEADGPLQRDEPFCYLYPEWDFRMRGFRDRWCRVRERVMEEGTSDFYTETLSEHRLLVSQVRSRFEHFLPELFRKVTRRYDGEDVDHDQLVDFVVDCRAGTTPSEKIYWWRERTQRDVAVALLLAHERPHQRVRAIGSGPCRPPDGGNGAKL